MKISFLSIGIEVAEAVVEALGAELPADPQRPEAAGNRPLGPVLQRYRAEVSVIFEGPDDGPDPLLRADVVRRLPRGGHAADETMGKALLPFLTETGRLGLKSVLARSALLALPALAMLVAPKIARGALPAAGKNGVLRNWVRGHLPAPPPRLPPAP